MSGTNDQVVKGQGGYVPAMDSTPALFTEIGPSDALWFGAGKEGTALDIGSVVDKKLVGLWTSGDQASGDTRCIYWRHYFEDIGSGEVARFFANVSAANVATGGTVNGAHISLEVAASCNVSGAGNAIRATLGADAATRTVGGTCASLLLDSNIAAGNTVPKSWSFLRVANSGAVVIPYFVSMPTVASAGILAVHTTDAVTHSIRCVDAAGTVFYIMCTTTTSNRTGGA